METNEVEWLSRRFDELQEYEAEAVARGSAPHVNRVAVSAGTWLLSTLHARLVGHERYSLLGELDRIRETSPIVEEGLGLKGGELARLLQRFVVGECLTDDEAPLYVVAKSIVERLLIRWPTAEVVPLPDVEALDAELDYLRRERETSNVVAHRLREIESRIETLEARWLDIAERHNRTLREAAATGLVAGSLVIGSGTTHLDRFRNLARDLAAIGDRGEGSTEALSDGYLLAIHERYGRYLRALAGLPTGALTEFPYLFTETVHRLETFYGGLTDAEYNDPNPPA